MVNQGGTGSGRHMSVRAKENFSKEVREPRIAFVFEQVTTLLEFLHSMIGMGKGFIERFESQLAVFYRKEWWKILSVGLAFHDEAFT